jgi:hypothetical protein
MEAADARQSPRDAVRRIGGDSDAAKVSAHMRSHGRSHGRLYLCVRLGVAET